LHNLEYSVVQLLSSESRLVVSRGVQGSKLETSLLMNECYQAAKRSWILLVACRLTADVSIAVPEHIREHVRSVAGVVLKSKEERIVEIKSTRKSLGYEKGLR